MEYTAPSNAQSCQEPLIAAPLEEQSKQTSAGADDDAKQSSTTTSYAEHLFHLAIPLLVLVQFGVLQEDGSLLNQTMIGLGAGLLLYTITAYLFRTSMAWAIADNHATMLLPEALIVTAMALCVYCNGNTLPALMLLVASNVGLAVTVLLVQTYRMCVQDEPVPLLLEDGTYYVYRHDEGLVRLDSPLQQ